MGETSYKMWLPYLFHLMAIVGHIVRAKSCILFFNFFSFQKLERDFWKYGLVINVNHRIMIWIFSELYAGYKLDWFEI